MATSDIIIALVIWAVILMAVYTAYTYWRHRQQEDCHHEFVVQRVCFKCKLKQRAVEAVK